MSQEQPIPDEKSLAPLLLLVDNTAVIISPKENQGRDKDDDDDESIRRLLSLSRQATPELLSASPPYVNITKLDLPNCGLSELPLGFERAFPNVRILFLSQNRFRQVPAVIGSCRQLQMVAFKDNNGVLQSIHPDALQPQLRWLILTNNQLQSLPDSIGERCHQLQKCMLSGNQLRTLPDTMKHCQNLELIRLASNQLDEIPMVLLQHCPKLAWIALSDNPCLSHVQNNNNNTASACASAVPLLQFNALDWQEGQVLGRGAGGVTRKVRWQDQYVAVKEYGGAMTSDGLPETERRLACAAAALHSPALVQVLGETPPLPTQLPPDHGGVAETEDAPAAPLSLVMEYLDGFVALAGPPSLESCSRDVYHHGTASIIQMSVEQAEAMISKLLQALTALHAVGICHGDFYGHNILVESTNPANVRLTDWGAAFFYSRTDTAVAPYIELAEIRAFSILCQEVYQHFVVAPPPPPNNSSSSSEEQKTAESILLAELIHYLDEGIAKANNTAAKLAAAAEEKDAMATTLITFEQILVWWKQKQLAVMATNFAPTQDES
ncbi:hypothetical protein ACA910_001027 [Epithemia clementina (nom. ined.)]